MRRTCLLLALVVNFGFFGSVQAQTPTRLPVTEEDIEASLGANFYGLYVEGQKVGILQKSLVRVDKESCFRDSLKVNIRGSAQGKKVEMQRSTVTDYDAQAPYALRRIRSWSKQGDSLTKAELTRKNDGKGYVLESVANGKTTKQDLPLVDFTLSDIVTPSVWIRKGQETGASLSNRALGLETQENRKIMAVNPDDSETMYEVEVHFPNQGTRMPEKYSRTGRLVGGMLDSITEFRLEEQDKARVLAKVLDFYSFQSAGIDKPLGNASTITEMVVEVVGDKGELLQAGPRQSVSKAESGAYILKLGRVHGKRIKATEAEIQANLLETTAYPVKNLKIQSFVKDLVKGARTPREKIAKIVAFAGAYIAPEYNAKDLPLASILETRKGDCTEYATLCTTLCRAAGIPARRVNGLVYTDDKKRVFEPHAWNEIVIDGYWTPIDAAWKETETNATHIRLSVENEKSGSLFSNTSFKLLQIKRKPQATASAG